MAEEINYKVNAWLTTKGTFLDQMKAGGAAADDFSTRWSNAGSRFNEIGARMSGTTGQIVGGLAKMGAATAGVGLAGGIAAATKRGLGFAKLLETSQLTIGTMFQAFNMGASDVAVLSGETSQFAANLERAAAMQQDIYDIALKSPGAFRDINLTYTMMASGLSSITHDLERQKSIISKSAVLVGLVEGDFKQLGADIGRMSQGLAGMDVRTFAALQGPFGEAMAEVTQKQIPRDIAAAFNKLDPEKRLSVIESVLSRIPPEVGDAYEASIEGILAAAESGLDRLSLSFAQPLYNSVKTSLSRISSDQGFFGGQSLEQLDTAASFFGRKLAGAFERGVSLVERAVTFFANNWQTLWMKAKASAAIIATSIKIAFVVGLTRMAAGAIVSGIGTAMRTGATAKQIATPIAAWIAKQSKATHVGIARGMKGQGRGMLGVIGRGVGMAASGFPRARQAIGTVARELVAVPSLISTSLIFGLHEVIRGAKGLPELARTGLAWTKAGFATVVARVKGLPALAATGLTWVKASFASMVARGRALPGLVRAGLGTVVAGFASMVAQARSLPATITAGFVATKRAFIGMVAKARALSLSGMLAGVGRRAGGLASRAGAGIGGMFGRGAQTGLLRMATAGTMLVALAGPALILGVVLGGLAVAFGGLAAYITSKWQEISTSLIEGIETGQITLTPLMVSLFTLWERLKLVGEALLGGSDATSSFNGFLDIAVGMIDTVSVGLGWFIKGLSLLVGVFGALKLGIAGIVGVVAWTLEMLAKVPKVGEGLAETAAEMRKSQESWFAGAQDTFTTSEKLDRAAEKIMNARLSPEQFAKAQERAAEMQKSLKGFLESAGKKTTPKGAKVNVGTVNVNVSLDEPDPDRVMAQLVKPLQKMATGRTQSFWVVEDGN